MHGMIAASGLVKSFGRRRAVDGISLDVRAGEIYGLVGSDGAGKTTTIRMLVGALKADAGTCSIAGYDLAAKTESARAQIGYLSQRFSLYEDLTVLENIRFFAEVRGMRHGEWLPRCMDILEFVGLASFKDRRAGHLSARPGAATRVGLLRQPPRWHVLSDDATPRSSGRPRSRAAPSAAPGSRWGRRGPTP